MSSDNIASSDNTPLQESEKLFFDSMKHLTTLSTGSILLLVTFLEKFFKERPEWKTLVVLALGSFVLSILCAVSSMFQSANFVKYSGKVVTVAYWVKDFAHWAALVTFVLGLVCLILFALKNLYGYMI